MASKLASALGREPQARIQPMPRGYNEARDLYAGGNPNFDERTGQYIQNGMQKLQEPPMQRLSPGVYRNAQGQLVNSVGQIQSQQPQQPQQSQQMQQMQPSQQQMMDAMNAMQAYSRDQFPGRGFQQQPGQLAQMPMQNVNIGNGMNMQMPAQNNGLPMPGMAQGKPWFGR